MNKRLLYETTESEKIHLYIPTLISDSEKQQIVISKLQQQQLSQKNRVQEKEASQENDHGKKDKELTEEMILQKLDELKAEKRKIFSLIAANMEKQRAKEAKKQQETSSTEVVSPLTSPTFTTQSATHPSPSIQPLGLNKTASPIKSSKPSIIQPSQNSFRRSPDRPMYSGYSSSGPDSYSRGGYSNRPIMYSSRGGYSNYRPSLLRPRPRYDVHESPSYSNRYNPPMMGPRRERPNEPLPPRFMSSSDRSRPYNRYMTRPPSIRGRGSFVPRPRPFYNGNY